MESTFYLLAMMIARFAVPLALLLLFGSWVEKRKTA